MLKTSFYLPDKWPECFGVGEFVGKRIVRRIGAVTLGDPSVPLLCVTGQSLYLTFC